MRRTPSQILAKPGEYRGFSGKPPLFEVASVAPFADLDVLWQGGSAATGPRPRVGARAGFERRVASPARRRPLQPKFRGCPAGCPPGMKRAGANGRPREPVSGGTPDVPRPDPRWRSQRDSLGTKHLCRSWALNRARRVFRRRTAAFRSAPSGSARRPAGQVRPRTARLPRETPAGAHGRRLRCSRATTTYFSAHVLSSACSSSVS